MYAIELTDTFGEEANYCWVRRATVSGGADMYGDKWTRKREQALVMRRAKAAVGLNGVKGVTSSYGDQYEFRPYGMAQVMFVTWVD